ncbi:MAG: hypothetical protein M3347_00690, partial [Armatimonadota bacterium]|nr:hypothetical protein [Armatimonadota bacterium]
TPNVDSAALPADVTDNRDRHKNTTFPLPARWTKSLAESVQWTRFTRLLSAALLAVALGSFCAQVFINWSYLEDDPLIFCRYALNFHRGYGWVMNPDERVNGCTSWLALWLITFLTSFLSLDWTIVALKLLGAACGAAILIGTRALSLRVLPGQPLIAALCMLIVACRLDFVLAMINALETPYACAALLWSLLAFWTATIKRSFTAEIGAGFLFVIAGMARPEMTIIYPLLCACRWILYKQIHWWALVGYALPFILVGLFSLHFYGSVLPNTYYAKQASLAEGLLEGGKYLAFYLLPSVPLFGVLLPVFCMAAVLIHGGRYSWILVLTAAVYAATILRTHGDWMADGRFATPILPLVVISWIVALRAVGRSLLPARPHLRPFMFYGLIAFGLSVVWDSYTSNLQTIQGYIASHTRITPPRLPSRLSAQRPLIIWMCGAPDGRRLIAEWISRHVRPGQLVMTSEVGLVTALNPDIRFLDAWGLTDAVIARMEGYERRQGGVAHRQDWSRPTTLMGSYISRRRPDFVIMPFRTPRGVGAAFPNYERVGALRIYIDNSGLHYFVIYKRLP